MRVSTFPTIRALLILTLAAGLGACSMPAGEPGDASATPDMILEKGGQEEFGPYELVENWPMPLPDEADGISHEGWTWGSVGAVYAESPDRIWIAQRGELPLPEGNDPWTPYAMLNPSVGNATGNDNGLGATCQPGAGTRVGSGAITMSSSWSMATATWSIRGRRMTNCST